MRAQIYPHVSTRLPTESVPPAPLAHRREIILTAIQVQIREWRRRVRVRIDLMTLSDGDLRDLGWTRCEAED